MLDMVMLSWSTASVMIEWIIFMLSINFEKVVQQVPSFLERFIVIIIRATAGQMWVCVFKAELKRNKLGFKGLKAAASHSLHRGYSYRQLVLICSRLGNIHRLVVQHVVCDCQSQTVIKILLFVSNLPLLCGRHCFSTVPLFITARSVILADIYFEVQGLFCVPRQVINVTKFFHVHINKTFSDIYVWCISTFTCSYICMYDFKCLSAAERQ